VNKEMVEELNKFFLEHKLNVKVKRVEDSQTYFYLNGKELRYQECFAESEMR